MAMGRDEKKGGMDARGQQAMKKKKEQMEKGAQRLMEWCKTLSEANCTKAQARGCAWGLETASCYFTKKNANQQTMEKKEEHMQKAMAWCKTLPEANCTLPQVQARGCTWAKDRAICYFNEENRVSNQEAMKSTEKTRDPEGQMQRLKDWCKTLPEANCTLPKMKAGRGCAWAKDRGICYWSEENMNRCAGFNDPDKCAGGAAKGFRGEPIRCEWSSEEEVCKQRQVSEEETKEMKEDSVADFCRSITEERKCQANAKKGCVYHAGRGVCYHDEKATDRMKKEFAMKGKGDARKGGKGDKRDMGKEFTGACVSQLKWCYQAGKDEEACKPLVDVGQCAFVQIGEYKACVAKEEEFSDFCYKKAQDSEEGCGKMQTAYPDKCTFVTSAAVSAEQGSDSPDQNLASDDTADGAFALQASLVTVLAVLLLNA